MSNKRTISRYSKRTLAIIFQFNRESIAIAKQNKSMQEIMQESVQTVSETSLLNMLHSFIADSSWLLETQYPTSVYTYSISRKRVK